MKGAARIFARAREEAQRVPGSASTGEKYQGSRKVKQRFEYSEKSTAGFVELHKDCIPTNTEFFEALKNEPDVERVELICLLYTSPSPRDGLLSRMPSSA